MGIIYRNGVPYGANEVDIPETVPVLSWGDTKTIGTVSGKDFKVTMPSNPNTTYTFTDGTNSFTVTSGGIDTVINVTPSIANNITGSGTSGKVPKFTGANTIGNGYSVDTTVTANSNNLITSGAVSTAIANLPEPMIFKGTLGTGGTITSLPTAAAANEGYTYKVITEGTYASTAAKVGDIFVSAKPEGANSYSWILIPAGDDVEDTWRTIKVNGTETLGSGISTGVLNFVNGNNTKVGWDDRGHGLSIDATVPCAYCDTAAGTAAKTATCTDYSLLSKSYLQVLIKNSNSSVSALTLSVNGKAAKTICINGVVSSSSNYTLPAGTYLVYYDGTNYHFRTDGKIVTAGIVDNSGSALYANASHSHGNVTSAGALQTSDVTIDSGDKLVITDNSNSDKIARASLSFDGATTTQCLTKAGTWASFSSSDTNTIPSAYFETVGSEQQKFAACTDYTLLSKSYIQVIIKNANSYAGKIYLAIGNNGLQSYKPIYINGTVSGSSNYTLPAGTYLVYYNGTNYFFRTDGKITTTGVVDTSNTELYTNNTGTVTGTGTSGYLTKWNSSSGITNGPQLSSSISSQTQSTKFLREDGTWSAPSYTTNTDTVPCAYCDTAAGTAAKTATCTDYTLTSNTYLHVLIKNANTKAGALTLSVNGQTAKTIYINGTTTSSSNYTLPAGTYIVYYDGTNYHFRTDGRIPGEANAAYRLNLQVADSYNANYPIAFGTAASGQALVGTDSGFTFNPTGNKIRGLNMITSTNSGSDEFSIGGGGGGLTISSTTTTLLPAKDLQIHATAGSISIMGQTWSGGTGTTAVVNTSGYLIKNTSSIRYKDNVDYEINRQDYHNQLMQLKPCTFEYKVQPGETQLGLIAEDVAEINPDIPNYDSEGLPESLKDRDLTTLLIIEAQEKDKIIQSLQSEIELLKQRLDNLES